jgi:hypothetical protein
MPVSLPIPALAAFLLAVLCGAARADLKDQLAVFFELSPEDSVVSLAQTSETTLSVETVDVTTTERKTLQEEVGPKPMARLLSEARAAGVSVTEWTPSASPAPAAAAEAAPSVAESEASAPRGRSLSSQRKNRLLYMGYQVPLATYVYGLAVPLALDVESDRIIYASPLLAAPVAFGAHFWFAKSRTFEDAHFLGTRYLSMAALYASYALPFSIMDWDSEPYRTSAFLSLATYPLGIYGGYMLGDRFVDMPGRIETQSKFALGFGILGFFTPFLYFENVDDHTEAIFRLGLGQSAAFAAGGHFISQYYRAGENIPGGVTTGILTHSALGAGMGAEIAALSDAEKLRPWLGAILAGGTLGFMEGLWYFRNRYDSNERGFYNSLGTGAGLLMGAGVLVLIGDPGDAYAEKVTITSTLLGGALLGYIATDILTSGMEERPAAGPSTWSDRLSVNLVPMPEPQVRDRELYYRYRLGNLTYTF